MSEQFSTEMDAAMWASFAAAAMHGLVVQYERDRSDPPDQVAEIKLKAWTVEAVHAAALVADEMLHQMSFRYPELFHDEPNDNVVPLPPGGCGGAG
jgi:hypothetical protein